MCIRNIFLLLAILCFALLSVFFASRLLSSEPNAPYLPFNEPIIGQTYNRTGNLVTYVQVGPRHFLEGMFDMQFERAYVMLQGIKEGRYISDWHGEVDFMPCVRASSARAAQSNGMVLVIGYDNEDHAIWGWAYAREFDPLWDVPILTADCAINFMRLVEEWVERDGREVWINLYAFDGVTVIGTTKRMIGTTI